MTLETAEALMEYIDARIDERVNDRLGAGSVEDSCNTTRTKDLLYFHFNLDNKEKN